MDLFDSEKQEIENLGEYRKVWEILPEFSKQNIINAHRTYQVDIRNLIVEYIKIFKELTSLYPNIQEADLHEYTARGLVARIVAKPRTTEYDVIVIGYTEPRILKSGQMSSRIYIAINTPDGLKMSVIDCRDNLANLVDSVELFAKYKVRLSKGASIFFATEDTVFENPDRSILVELGSFSNLMNALNIPIFTSLEELAKFPSQINEKGYVEELDLRAFKAIIIDANRGVRPDGTKWARYVVTDGIARKNKVLPDGTVVPEQLKVWLPFSLLKFDRNSQVYLIGTVKKDEDGSFMMNAISIYPTEIAFPRRDKYV